MSRIPLWRAYGYPCLDNTLLSLGSQTVSLFSQRFVSRSAGGSQPERN